QDSNINDLYVNAPNYQAGKDMVTGLKRYYKVNVVEETYTKLGQQDYQAEITQLRSKNPKAVFAFLPGGMGIKFLKQYDQAGLRGPFTYNVNHHPIQNFYLLKSVNEPNGDIEMRIQKTIFENHKDAYYQDCKMK